jgi:hypothetical protein
MNLDSPQKEDEIMSLSYKIFSYTFLNIINKI